ncbi:MULTISPECIES: amidohydrolase [Micrococcaceae]|uniref:amidohydrolase n=1 Tax=Micrococcaceae TaxID=1268 RepID=UPI0021064045|nr:MULTISPECIES: amidohydrolase [Micrococcaceae]HRO95280.1 amidohydrolase [Citricoccus sp.]
MDPGQPTASAIGIRQGTITWVGQASDVQEADATEILRAAGGCVTPGLVDAHIHPVLGLEVTRGADLNAVTAAEQLHAALASPESSSTPGADWVLGWGLDPSMVTGRNLCARDLDEAVPHRPAFVRLFDGHSAVVNTRALELAGLTGRERFASSAVVEVDADGLPTGFLKEWDAMALVLAHVPAPAFEDRLDALLGVLAMMGDAGLTGGQVLDWSDGMLDLVAAAEERGELPIRLCFSPWIMPGDSEDRLRSVIDLQGRSGRRWTVEGVKLMIDGTIDNGTAWLDRPDVNGESTGPLWLDARSFTETLHRLDAQGIRTTTHAIGDGAVRYVLDAIASAPGGAGGPDGTPRHRIEHIETIPDDLVGRFAELDVAASMQPTHCSLYCSGDGTDNWSRRLGDERTGNAWRLGSLRRAGVTVAVGSDWPIAPCDPLRIIADGQLRREAGKPSQPPVVPEEALTAFQLLEGFTTHRARSWGRADGGRIAVGQPADLSVFSGDPLTTAPDDLPGLAVVATVVDGTVRRPGRG